jgi:hypothetical protein
MGHVWGEKKCIYRDLVASLKKGTHLGPTRRWDDDIEVDLCFVLDFLALEDGTNTLSRNVGKGLPFDAV